MDVRAYLVLERALLKRLKRDMLPILAAYHAKIMEKVNAGRYGEAMVLAHDLDLTPVGEPNREYIKYMLLAFANFGAKQCGKGARGNAPGYEQVVSKAAASMVRALTEDLKIDVVTSSLQLIAAARPQPELVQKLEPHEYVKDFVSFAAPGIKGAKLIASQHSSRLATWGFAAEAEILGITTYRVTAVLDGRTSDFCRFINGKTFQVEDARQTVNAVLALDNPEDVAVMQPWPKQTKASMEQFKTLTREELVARNLHIPPYHPMCRTLLVTVKNQPRLEKPEIPTPTMVQAPVTKETFLELGPVLTDKQVEYWNSYMGVNPIEAYSKMAVQPPVEVLKKPLKKNIVITKAGNINFNVKAPVANGTAKVTYSYNPLYGELSLAMALFDGLTKKQVTTFTAASLAGAAEVGANIGASVLTAAATDAAGAAAYIGMGFSLPTVQWFNFKDAALDLLPKLELPDSIRQSIAGTLAEKNESAFVDLLEFLSSIGEPAILDKLLVGQTLIFSKQL